MLSVFIKCNIILTYLTPGYKKDSKIIEYTTYKTIESDEEQIFSSYPK